MPGSFYSIGGYQMHINCTGSGSPTVVLEAAASATWLAWRRVQAQLSQLTRICSYDRAGHGWSDPRPTSPRCRPHRRRIARPARAVRPERPLVLVGHSAGGLYVREYARQFPTEVAGVALLDTSSPQQLDALPGWRTVYEQNTRDYPARLRWKRLRVWSGWERLMGRCAVGDSREAPEIVGQYAALMCRPAFVGGEESEYVYFEETSQRAARLASFGALPLLVISRDPAAEEDRSAKSVAQERAWHQEQERMKKLSPLSWRVGAARPHGAVSGRGVGPRHARPSRDGGCVRLWASLTTWTTMRRRGRLADGTGGVRENSR